MRAQQEKSISTTINQYQRVLNKRRVLGVRGQGSKVKVHCGVKGHCSIDLLIDLRWESGRRGVQLDTREGGTVQVELWYLWQLWHLCALFVSLLSLFRLLLHRLIHNY